MAELTLEQRIEMAEHNIGGLHQHNSGVAQEIKDLKTQVEGLKTEIKSLDRWIRGIATALAQGTSPEV